MQKTRKGLKSTSMEDADGSEF